MAVEARVPRRQCAVTCIRIEHHGGIIAAVEDDRSPFSDI
jgi:hypothetical protein